MDIQDVAKLAELMSEHDLNEISYETEACKLKLKRGRLIETVIAAAPVHSGGALPASAAVPEPPPEPALPAIASPIVGTFYSSPAPDAPAFIEIGDRVGPDTIVCIIEAMKVMNEIKAEMAGTVKRVLVENGTPVEYGQPLFELEPA